jgi:catechol 2,3-dioxygenase-like lactoylglutathione lyase family enzyme
MTVIEFEKNVGPDEEGAVVQAANIGRGKGIDHVGIRVSDAERAWVWYAEKLGFNYAVFRYQPNPTEPLKNFRPFIARSAAAVDINLIVNANRVTPHNVLTFDGLHPGIVYVAFYVNDLDQAELQLQRAGVRTFRDTDLDATASLLGALNRTRIKTNAQSIFLQDENHNIIRLIQK